MGQNELGLLDQNGPTDEETGQTLPATAVARRSLKVMEEWSFIKFKGRAMVAVADPHPHYVPLRKERFDQMAYQVWGGLTRGQVSDMFAYVCSMAPDRSEDEHLITFGTLDYEAVDNPGNSDKPSEYHQPLIWNMKSLGWEPEVAPVNGVWRSPYSPLGAPQEFFGIVDDDHPKPRLEFIMQLAGGDTGLYDDIMQSIAPIIMDKKPDGVIWWVGAGANGKSTLMDAIYRVFPGLLASITVKRLVDGRDTPSLNGALANIVKESSEGRIDDTEIYKSLGTHENFRVHKFHSQDDIEIQGNLHSIFSANTIPSFNDKGYSARRRTFIIPFKQQFESDPEFERKTFTPEFFGALVREMGWYAKLLRKQGYRYKWSATTLAAKADYDMEASNAEEYARHIVDEGVVAFTSFSPLRMDYESWCADMGYVPLGIGNLRKAMSVLGFEPIAKRGDQNRMSRIYRLASVEGNLSLELIGGGRPGLFTIAGFQPIREDKPPDVEKPKQQSILEGKW